MSTTVPGLPPLHQSGEDLVECPSCGLRSEPARACPRCGAAVGPRAGGFWREGRTLVALRDAALPDLCVRCGDPGDGRRIRHRLSWHHPALFLLLLFWLIPYVIVALAIRRHAVSVCARHRSIRRRSLVAARTLLGAAVVAGAAAIGMESGWLGGLFARERLRRSVGTGTP